jgi:hypothetical protein
VVVQEEVLLVAELVSEVVVVPPMVVQEDVLLAAELV